MNELFSDADACEVCGVVEGEHDWRKHGGNEQYAEQLKAWKEQLREGSSHHK